MTAVAENWLELLDRHLRARPARYADARYLLRDTLRIRVEDDQSNVHFERTRGGFVRAAIDSAWGGAAFNTKDQLPGACEMAWSAARMTGGKPMVIAGAPPAVARLRLKPRSDPRGIPAAEKAALMRQAVEVMRASPRVVSARATYTETVGTRFVVTDRGSAVEEEFMELAVALRAAARAGDVTELGNFDCASGNDFAAVRSCLAGAREAAAAAVQLLDAEPVEVGRRTVVLHPTLAGTLIHESLGHFCEADNVLADEYLEKKMRIGARIASPILDISDDPGVTGARACYRYDDEAVEARRTALVREGRLVGLLHTRQTAARFGVEPTGHARTVGHRFAPLPRMSVTCIHPGLSTLDELLRGAEGGIYMSRSFGGETEGENFHLSAARVHRIEGGRIGTPLRSAAVIGNTFEMLKSLDGVADDQVLVDGSFYCGKGDQYPLAVGMAAPHIRVADVMVGPI